MINTTPQPNKTLLDDSVSIVALIAIAQLMHKEALKHNNGEDTVTATELLREHLYEEMVEILTSVSALTQLMEDGFDEAKPRDDLYATVAGILAVKHLFYSDPKSLVVYTMFSNSIDIMNETVAKFR